jgi:hypothetical protein
MTTANNVLQFPVERFNKPFAPSSIEEVEEKVDTFKAIHIQEAIETLIPILFNQIQSFGFNPSDEEFDISKDGALVAESIRSFLCKIYDIEHPLQIIADGMFEVTEEEITVSDNVKIVITKNTEEGL